MKFEKRMQLLIFNNDCISNNLEELIRKLTLG